jgi:hypothetical protein
MTLTEQEVAEFDAMDGNELFAWMLAAPEMYREYFQHKTGRDLSDVINEFLGEDPIRDAEDFDSMASDDNYFTAERE